jgi:hypothetical protein
MHRQIALISRTGEAELDRLGPEIKASTSHVPLVFTDIRNSHAALSAISVRVIYSFPRLLAFRVLLVGAASAGGLICTSSPRSWYHLCCAFSMRLGHLCLE